MKIQNKKDAVLGTLILSASVVAGVAYFLQTPQGRKWTMDVKNRTRRFIERLSVRSKERKLLAQTHATSSRFDLERMENESIGYSAHA